VWLWSKLRQIDMVLRAGVVTLRYPFEPSPVPIDFRGAPSWDHHKCIGCGGCADHCVARCILVRDVCQEIRVMLYDGSRCTYCGRCADVCPEDAIRMSDSYQLATGEKDDVTTRMELFMLTCQRCGRCYELETKNAVDRLDLRGFRYDSIETRAVIRKKTERFSLETLEETKRYERPVE